MAKKILALSCAAVLAISLSGCASGSDESKCKDFYSNVMDDYLVATMEGDMSATSQMIANLGVLAEGASDKFKAAVAADLENLADSSDGIPEQTAALCAEYLN